MPPSFNRRISQEVTVSYSKSHKTMQLSHSLLKKKTHIAWSKHTHTVSPPSSTPWVSPSGSNRTNAFQMLRCCTLQPCPKPWSQCPALMVLMVPRRALMRRGMGVWGVGGWEGVGKGGGVAGPFKLLLSLQKDLGILSLSQGNRQSVLSLGFKWRAAWGMGAV